MKRVFLASVLCVVAVLLCGQAHIMMMGIGPGNAGAAPVLVSKGSAAHATVSSTTLSIVFNNSPTNGNTVIITVFHLAAVSVSNIKNAGSGLTFTKITGASGTGTTRNYDTYSWTVAGSGNTATYTVTFGTSVANAFGGGYELSGGQGVIDKVVYAEDVTGTSLTTGTTGTTSQVNEFAFALFGGPGPANGNTTFSSPTNSFVIDSSGSTGDLTNNARCLQSRTLSATGTYSTGVTASANITTSSTILMTVK